MDDQSGAFQGLPLHIPDDLIAEIFHQAWAKALAAVWYDFVDLRAQVESGG